MTKINWDHKLENQLRESGTHVQSLALRAHGRLATPLPLSAGKQQTRELTPSKIITITVNTDNYQRREVDGQWGRMEQSTQVSMGHTVKPITIQWNNPTTHAYGA